MKALQLNAVLARELRARGRRKSVPFLLSIVLLLLVGIAAVAWFTAKPESYEPVFGDNLDAGAMRFGQYARAGRQIFEWVTLAIFCLVCFVVPGFTGGAITGERDRQTLIPMQVSLLSPFQIVFGKMTSSSSFTLFIVLMSMPVVALGYGIGGLTFGEVVRVVIGLLFVATLWATLAIFASSLVRRSAPAVVMAYALMLLILVILPIVAAIFELKALLITNPYVAFCDFVAGGSERDIFGFGEVGPISAAAYGVARESPAYWVRSLFVFVPLIALAIVIACRRLRTPAVRER